MSDKYKFEIGCYPSLYLFQLCSCILVSLWLKVTDIWSDKGKDLPNSEHDLKKNSGQMHNKCESALFCAPKYRQVDLHSATSGPL